jgi:hypothetical protein
MTMGYKKTFKKFVANHWKSEMAHSLIKITSKRDIVDTKTHASGAT